MDEDDRPLFALGDAKSEGRLVINERLKLYMNHLVSTFSRVFSPRKECTDSLNSYCIASDIIY